MEKTLRNTLVGASTLFALYVGNFSYHTIRANQLDAEIRADQELIDHFKENLNPEKVFLSYGDTRLTMEIINTRRLARIILEGHLIPRIRYQQESFKEHKRQRFTVF